MFNIDTNSMMSTLFIIQVLFAFVMFRTWLRTRSHLRGLGYVVLTLVFNAAGRMMYLLSTDGSRPLVLLLSIVLLSTGAVLFYIGLASFIGRRPRFLLLAIWFVLVNTIPVLLRYLYPESPVFLLSADIGNVLIGMLYIELLRHAAHTWFHPRFRIITLLYILYTSIFIIHSSNLISFIIEGVAAADAISSPIRMITTAFSTFLLFAINFSMLNLVNEYLLHELESSTSGTIDQLKERVDTDALTGAASRVTMEMRIDEAVARASKGSGLSAFSVMILDIDDFKQVNDSHGHNAGDQVLKETVELVTQQIRDQDIIGRWGGDEFIIIVYNLSSASLKMVCSRIIDRIAQKAAHDPRMSTVSIGYTSYLPGDDAKSLIKRADEQLYKAKRSGKNQAIGTTSFLRSEKAELPG